MTGRLAACVASLVIFVQALSAGAAEIVPGPVPARVLAVVDGDTIAVRAHIWLGQEVETRVRLSGIDAPELKGRCAFESERAAAAKDFLTQQIAGGTVLLDRISYEKYGGRVRATVRAADGTDLSQLMIRMGHARPYDGGRRGPWCAEANAESGEPQPSPPARP